MPLNSAIPLSFQAPKIANPFEMLAGFEQMKYQREERQALRDHRQSLADMNRFTLEQKQGEAARAQGLREYFAEVAETGGDLDLRRLSQFMEPKEAQTFYTGWRELRRTEFKDADDFLQSNARVLAAVNSRPEAERPEAYGIARQTRIQQGLLRPEDAPEQYDPAWIAQQLRAGLSLEKQRELDNPKDDIRTVGNSIVRLPGAGGDPSVLYTAPESAPAAGTLGDFMDSFARGLGLQSGRQLNPRQKLQAKAQYEAAGRAPATDNEPLVAITGPDGNPVLVRRGDAVGQRPASAREGGRPVTAALASAIAELDTSLDDIDVLRETLESTKGSTGTLAYMQSMLPDALTDLTGWGSDAKSRQGVIDRVRQVIGKALEGGVLRKEDEVKYTKILPTLSDTADVAKSKIDGLQSAITLRRSRELDALEDGGYDVANYRARVRVPKAVEDTLRDQADGEYTLSDGSTWVKAQGRITKKGSQ